VIYLPIYLVQTSVKELCFNALFAVTTNTALMESQSLPTPTPSKKDPGLIPEVKLFQFFSSF